MSYSSEDRSLNLGILEAEGRSRSDPARPLYHFHPPAQWMNDPNGTIFADGMYHVFYQYNPYGDAWDHMHWGHARSSDLLAWEYLPLALVPDIRSGEAHCFSGTAALGADGRPRIVYTSVAAVEGNPPHVQRIVEGSPDLLVWKRKPNGELRIDSPGLPPLKGDWRDPYFFRSGTRTYLLVSALGTDDLPLVLLFEAKDANLDAFGYRGILLSLGAGTGLFECPNFFRLGGRWVLLGSPYGPVPYRVGSFDEEAASFSPELSGLVDHSPDYYATNTIESEGEGLLLFGWIRGLPPGRGWSGCLALPREIGLDAGGCLVSRPSRRLRALRGARLGRGDCEEKGGRVRIEATFLSNSETVIRLSPGPAATLSVEAEFPGGGRETLLSIREGRLSSGPVEAPLAAPAGGGDLEVDLFLDRSVMEIFASGGRTCLTRRLEGLHGIQALAIAASGGAKLLALECHEMRPLRYTIHPSLPREVGEAWRAWGGPG